MTRIGYFKAYRASLKDRLNTKASLVKEMEVTLLVQSLNLSKETMADIKLLNKNITEILIDTATMLLAKIKTNILLLRWNIGTGCEIQSVTGYCF